MSRLWQVALVLAALLLLPKPVFAHGEHVLPLPMSAILALGVGVPIFIAYRLKRYVTIGLCGLLAAIIVATWVVAFAIDPYVLFLAGSFLGYTIGLAAVAVVPCWAIAHILSQRRTAQSPLRLSLAAALIAAGVGLAVLAFAALAATSIGHIEPDRRATVAVGIFLYYCWLFAKLWAPIVACSVGVVLSVLGWRQGEAPRLARVALLANGILLAFCLMLLMRSDGFMSYWLSR